MGIEFSFFRNSKVSVVVGAWVKNEVWEIGGVLSLEGFLGLGKGF